MFSKKSEQKRVLTLSEIFKNCGIWNELWDGIQRFNSKLKKQVNCMALENDFACRGHLLPAEVE